MTVTINTLGSNSRQIVIDSETSATNIINAVNTSLTALGWTLIDTVTSGSRGCQVTRVYSAPNADSVTTKYMIIRYDTPRQYWVVSCAENWNTSTNTATNECWYGGRQILLPLQYSNCSLYVFATARYACFMGVVSSEPSAWQGVFEFERYAAEDIAAKDTPCFGWTSSLTIGEPYGNIVTVSGSTPLVNTTSASNGCVPIGFAVPRTKNGLTGASAAGVFNVLTSLGAFPPTKSQSGVDFSNGGITQTLNNHTGMLGTWGDSSTYAWDANKVPISNLQLNGYDSFYLLGRIYGLKITAKLGAVLDTTTVPVDANLFYSAGGSNTTHYLLGIHGHYSDRLAPGTNRMTALTSTAVTSLGTPAQSVLVGGRYLYFTTTTGFHKFDIQTQGFTTNILPAQQYWSVKFDGDNSLYVTANANDIIYKINLSNDTNTTLSMTGTWSGLAVDDDNLYVGSRVAGTNTTVKRVALSTFTEAATYTVPTGNASNLITHMTAGDYSGYLYVATMIISPLSNDRISRIDRSSGTIIQLTPGANSTAGNVSAGFAQTTFFDGVYLYFIMASSTATAGSQTVTERIRISDFSINGEYGWSTGSGWGAINGFNGYNTLGSFEPPQYAGQLIYITAASGGSFRVVFSDPRNPLIALTPLASINFDTTNISYGQYASDQCSLYTLNNNNKITRYTNTFRNYNFNGIQTSNLLIAQ